MDYINAGSLDTFEFKCSVLIYVLVSGLKQAPSRFLASATRRPPAQRPHGRKCSPSTSARGAIGR